MSVLAEPLPKYALPTTARFADGDVVPIPTRPALSIIKFVAEEEPTTNEGPAPMFDGFTERDAQGVDVPIPILEFVVSKERRFPIFHAFTPDARVVEADWLKLR